MPSDVLKRKILKQKAVYWAPNSLSDDGQRGFAAPVEISVRWTDEAVLFVGPAGDELASNAVIYVDRDLELEGAIKLGLISSIGSLLATTDPYNDEEGVWEIKQTKKIPDRRARRYLRKVFI